MTRRNGTLGILFLTMAALAAAACVKDDPFVSVPDELTTPLTIQTAYNGDEIVWRFRWPARGDWYHDMLVFQDGKWVRHGDSTVGRQEYGIYEDRLSFLVDPGTVRGFANQGCYVTCHAGSRFLSDQLSPETIKAHPHLGDEGLKQADLRKYLPDSREGDAWWDAPWDKIKDKEALDDLQAKGVLLDFWHWRAHRSEPMGYADDQFVLEYRRSDAGRGPYTTNWDAETNQPQWMFDPDKVGIVALQWDDLVNRKIGQDGLYSLTTANAVPFDANREWKEGDVIPRRLVREPDASRGTIRSQAEWRNGEWHLELRRKMDTGFTDDQALLEGRTYNIGFAVHKGATGSRWHHISHPQRVGIGVPGDITAVRFDGESPDWGTVPEVTLPLIYPAQVTWEWLTSDSHPGAEEVRADRRSCISCHGSTPMDLGKLMQASVYHEQPAHPVSWWLTLLAVLSVLVGGTLTVLNLTPRTEA